MLAYRLLVAMCPNRLLSSTTVRAGDEAQLIKDFPSMYERPGFFSQNGIDQIG